MVPGTEPDLPRLLARPSLLLTKSEDLEFDADGADGKGRWQITSTMGSEVESRVGETFLPVSFLHPSENLKLPGLELDPVL